MLSAEAWGTSAVRCGTSNTNGRAAPGPVAFAADESDTNATKLSRDAVRSWHRLGGALRSGGPCQMDVAILRLWGHVYTDALRLAMVGGVDGPTGPIERQISGYPHFWSGADVLACLDPWISGTAPGSVCAVPRPASSQGTRNSKEERPCNLWTVPRSCQSWKDPASTAGTHHKCFSTCNLILD